MYVSTQSPSSAMMAEGGSENPTLKDNWDDAEGYYRESHTAAFHFVLSTMYVHLLILAH